MVRKNLRIFRSINFDTLTILLLIVWLPALWFLWLYLHFTLLSIAGVIVAIYSVKFNPGSKTSTRYLFLLAPFLILCVWTGVKTFYFIALIFTTLFLLESYRSKISYLPALSILAISPITLYISKIAGFNIRLYLTEASVSAMQVFKLNVYSNGNIIWLNGHSFFVDEACAGLKLLEASILVSIIIAAFYEKYYSGIYNWFIVTFWLLLTITLNLICNLVRIIILVIFEIMPTNPTHMLVGVFCMIFYVIIPLALVGSKLNRLLPNNKEVLNTTTSPKLWLMAILVAVLFCSGIRSTYLYYNQLNEVGASSFYLKDYKSTPMGDGITKLSKAQSLIYIKPIANFYNADHNPSICWQGSGYVLKSFDKLELNDGLVFFGILENKGSKFYTAWWYQDNSNTVKTIDQFTWRYDACIHQKQYNLINVNSISYKQLLTDMTMVRSERTLFSK